MNLTLYLGVVCSIICELLSGVLLINGLLGREQMIPKSWALAFVTIAVAYILLVPDGLTTGSYVLTLLYVRYGYKKTWRDSIIITILSVVLAGVVELICSFPFVFLMNGYGQIQ